jgi:hypothetical protein
LEKGKKVSFINSHSRFSTTEEQTLKTYPFKQLSYNSTNEKETRILGAL